MRLTFPYQTERLGVVRIYGVQHVFELDSGSPRPGESALSWGTTVCQVPDETLRDVQRRMAVVVPCRNERLKLLEGVLTGIPHDCTLVFVSNSDREPIDRFAMERDSVERFCRFNQRSAMIVHQRDPGLAAAFAEAGMPELIDSSGLVRHGKGEGMIAGTALARLTGAEYVGFVDADNYVPGSVTEYVKAYAADFHLTDTPYAMVRISWHSKPKVVDGSIFFNRWGRASETTNRFLNLLVAYVTGFGTEAIRTGNAGEHAMTMELALRLPLASGFAVEPMEMLELFERYGGVDLRPGASVDTEVMREGVEVYQVETRNPHFHENKGEEHVEEMSYAALAAIHNSPVSPPRLRDEIVEHLLREGIDPAVALSTPAVTYPPLSTLVWGTFGGVLAERADTFGQILFPGPDAFFVTPPPPLDVLEPRHHA